MPASAAQVFGPTTVDPGFTTTGEKTLLTMNTTLPAGGKNVIICVFMGSSAFTTTAQGVFRIKKGSTILYGSYITQYFNSGFQRAKPAMILAVDDNPTGNDFYTFVINITTAGTSTGSVHVQGMVIKADDAVWGYNTTAVSISAGVTATVTSMTTNFPANSKVVIISYVYGSRSDGYTGDTLLGAGKIKLKSGTTVVSSNQFNQGSYDSITPAQISLAYLEITSSSSQSYSVEVTNNGIASCRFYAEIVAFTVENGAFLDTGSVALTSGSQVTVGNLSTSLSGNVVVIGLAATENTSSSAATAFNANDVVLQLNNSSTGQISNLVDYYLSALLYHGSSGILPLLRFDIGASNPSYQIKMTARASGINGEAKILAFSLLVGLDIFKQFSEIVNLSEAWAWRRLRIRGVSEGLNVPESSTFLRGRFSRFLENVNVLENSRVLRSLLRILVEVLNISELFRKSLFLFRKFVEQLNVSESFRLSMSKFRSVLEDVNISESFSWVRNLFRNLVAGVGIIEGLRKAGDLFRSFVENLEILEVSKTLRSLLRKMVETVHIVENNVVFLSAVLVKVLSENVFIQESFSRLKSIITAFVENVRLFEAVVVSRVLSRVWGEIVNVGEAISKSISLNRVLSETVNLVESFTVSKNMFRKFAESLNLYEFASYVKNVFRVVLEILVILFSYRAITRLVFVFSETVRLAESFKRAMVKLIGWVASKILGKGHGKVVGEGRGGVV